MITNFNLQLSEKKCGIEGRREDKKLRVAALCCNSSAPPDNNDSFPVLEAEFISLRENVVFRSEGHK